VLTGRFLLLYEDIGDYRATEPTGRFLPLYEDIGEYWATVPTGRFCPFKKIYDKR